MKALVINLAVALAIFNPPTATAFVFRRSSTEPPKISLQQPPLQQITSGIDPATIDHNAIVQQMDKGELPSVSILNAIFNSSSHLSTKGPDEIRKLKDFILGRIVNDKEMLIRVLAMNNAFLNEELAENIQQTKKITERYGAATPYANMPATPPVAAPVQYPASAAPVQYPTSAAPSDVTYIPGPNLPLTVGYDPFLQKPKTGFFGKIKGWIFGRSKANVGHLHDVNPKLHNTFRAGGAQWGRSTVYYPPLHYSSHLVPTATGAFDMKNYGFRQFRDGHPRISRRRFVTRVILKQRERPYSRTNLEMGVLENDKKTFKEHLDLDKELHTERKFYEKVKSPNDRTEARWAVPDPRLEEQYGFKPSKLYKRPLPQLDYHARQIGYSGDMYMPTGIYTGPGNQYAKSLEEQIGDQVAEKQMLKGIVKKTKRKTSKVRRPRKSAH